MTPWWALADKVKYVFECIFWISNHLDLKISQLIDIVTGNISRKILCGWEGWFLNPNFFQFINLPENQLQQHYRFLLFLKCTLSWSKIGNIINQSLAGFSIVPFYENYKILIVKISNVQKNKTKFYSILDFRMFHSSIMLIKMNLSSLSLCYRWSPRELLLWTCKLACKEHNSHYSSNLKLLSTETNE